MLTVRPKVAELTFQLYGRPLHPELFVVFESCTIERGGYSAKIDITGAGHVVTWRYGGLTLTEVAASAHHPLPKMRRLLGPPSPRPAQRPRGMPRRSALPDEFPTRTGRSRGLLDLPAGIGHRRDSGRECCTASARAAAWPSAP